MALTCLNTSKKKKKFRSFDLNAPWTKINCVTWNIMAMGMPKLSVRQVLLINCKITKGWLFGVM